jgi:hypothetical protein
VREGAQRLRDGTAVREARPPSEAAPRREQDAGA